MGSQLSKDLKRKKGNNVSVPSFGHLTGCSFFIPRKQKHPYWKFAFSDGYLGHIFFVQMMQKMQNKMFTILLNHFVLTDVMKGQRKITLPWCLCALTSAWQIHHENLDCDLHYSHQ